MSDLSLQMGIYSIFLKLPLNVSNKMMSCYHGKDYRHYNYRKYTDLLWPHWEGEGCKRGRVFICIECDPGREGVVIAMKF